MLPKTSLDIEDLTLLEFMREKFKLRNFIFLFLCLLVVQLVLLSIFFPERCFFLASFLGNCPTSYQGHRNIPEFQIREILASSSDISSDRVPLCPLVPPDLKGPVKVKLEILSWAQIEWDHRNLQPGGRYQPQNCTARHRVAVIVPFRDRDMHLKVFLNNIHSFLQKQQLDYGIYVVDLAPDVRFNRAMLMNIGYVEASHLYNYQCFIFHDVDLIPEYDLNMYSCPENPRHMSTAIDKFKYRLPYTNIFGGVVAMTKEQFQIVNGFSNQFFGWGGEDDDMFNRIRLHDMSITRYTSEVARYKMLSHVRDKPNPARFSLIKKGKKRFKNDGINSLKYKRLRLEFRQLYTYIQVDINEKEVMNVQSKNKTSHPS